MFDSLLKHSQFFTNYTELRQQTNSSSSVIMRKGSLIKNAQTRSGGVSARCYRAGAFGFASSPGDDDAAVGRVINEANSNVDLFHRKSSYHMPPLPVTEPGVGEYDYRATTPRLSANERLDRVRDVDAYIERACPDLINTDIFLSELTMEKALLTSEGAQTYSYVPRANLRIRMSLEGNDGVVDLSDTHGGFGDMQTQFNKMEWIYDAIDQQYAELKRKADGVFCVAGYRDVILDSAVAGILAHEAIGHTCEADLVLGGSVAADCVGQQVAAEKFSLIDYAQRGPTGDASIAIHVDDEGTPCRDVTIIENGVLRAFLHNKETAARMDQEPTGNARAYTFEDEPLVRMRNTAIVAGDDKLDDMISAVDDGYYLKRSTNGQADSTGEFMFGISLGYEIKNGRLARPIRETTISGVAFDMLKTITHVGDETHWGKSGWCGKKQLIPVAMGGPAIKCKINVGGR